MRMSIHESDPGYDTWVKHRHKKIIVRLNGEIAQHVTTADEEKGMIVRLNIHGIEVKETTVFGEVKIEVSDS